MRPALLHHLVLIGSLLVGGLFVVACGDGNDSTFPNGAGGNDGGVGDPGDGSVDLGDGAFGGGVNPANVVSVTLDPPSATVTVDGSAAQSAAFSLRATFIDGTTSVVTPQSYAFDRPDLAKATGGVPITLATSGPFAGTGHLQAVYGGKAATASFTVNMKMREVGPNVPPAAIAALGGGGALTSDPKISRLLYPYDKTLFPLGLASPLVMWTAPAANDVYRLAYEENGYSYEGFFVVGANGQLRVPQAAWDHLTASNQGDPIKVSLDRWDATSGTAYASANEQWPIAGASLRGAIYYWTTSAGGHLSRIRPGTGTQPEILNGGRCMGCHGVSADGTTLVAATEGNTLVTEPGGSQKNDGSLGRAWVSFDLPGATTRYNSNRFAGNVAVNPDGKYVVFGSQTLRLGDTHTGQEITGSGIDTVTLDANMNGLMTPAFSPDGKKLVAVEGAGNWYHNLVNGKLLVLDFDEATHKFTNPHGFAAASSFPAGQRAISYPTFAPDSAQIAFHVGDYATGCDEQGCDDAAKQVASLWLQNVNGQPPVRLATLTDSSPNAADHDLSYEPTFNPVDRGGYYWVVFTSARDWGNKITGTPNNGKKRLWVAAIDKNAPAGADPSHPAFFLEGQEEDTTNMRGFWALAACTPTAGGGACSAGFECCSGFCDQGKCVDVSQVACKQIGDTCAQASDCCNGNAVACVGGKCAVRVY